MDWTCLCVLPNIAMRDPIEGGPIALASAHDIRVRAEASANEVLANFLGSFRDTQGNVLTPSVLLWDRGSRQQWPSFDALCSFRDLTAASHVLLARAQALTANFVTSTQWMDSFEIHPWMVTADGQHISCRTLALGAIDTVDRFVAQSSPGVPLRSLSELDLDRALFDALRKRWFGFYTGADRSHFNTAVFRSLNMAFRAGSMPGAADVSAYDLGLSLALWVSAFEILAHPGGGADVTRGHVFELLDQAPYLGTKIKDQRYETRSRSGVVTLRNLPSALYSAIYFARNQFLHGNPIDADITTFGASDKHLLNFAPCLYRLALAAKLDVRWKEPRPDLQEVDAIGEWFSEEMKFWAPQRQVEKALLTAAT